MTAGLWLGTEPLVLASGSVTRRSLLESAGIPCTVCPADLDERSLEAALGPDRSGAEVALNLARAKALAVSLRQAGALVLGADQTLDVQGRLSHKPASLDAARQQLRTLSGISHRLASAAVLTRDGHVLHEFMGHAILTMRPLTGDFIERYLERVGAGALSSVGAYQVEGLGIQLFERIEGDQSTILGLPLLDVLAALRRLGVLLG